MARVPTSAVAQTFTSGEVVPNMTLRYKGDSVPFITGFLKRKGEKFGKYLLPIFRAGTAERVWDELPGDDKATYTVIEIETDRRDAKTKKQLPDLAIIRCSSFHHLIRIALRPEDVVAKFTAISIPTPYDPEILSQAERNAVSRGRDTWQNEIQSEGW